jgi:hypothetical protein
MSESTAHTTEASGWGRGLPAWVLASYTDPGDLVLDLDGDTGVQTAAATMRRNYLDIGDQAPHTDGWGLTGQAALVTSRWPRRPAGDTAAGQSAEADRLPFDDAVVALAPAGHLALVSLLPLPTGPLSLHPGPLLTAAYDAGLGHLEGVHAVAAHPPFGSPGWQERSVVGYRCALVLRKAGRHAHP